MRNSYDAQNCFVSLCICRGACFLFSLYRWHQQMSLQRPFDKWPCSNRNPCPTDLHLMVSPLQGWDNGQVQQCPCHWKVSHLPSASSCMLRANSPYVLSYQDCLQGNSFTQCPSKLSVKLSMSDMGIQARVSVSSSHKHSFHSPGKCVWFQHHSENSLLFSHHLIVISLLFACNGISYLCGI